MNEAVLPELLLVGVSFATGFLCLFGYDLLCILRVLFRTPSWLGMIEDILYWCVAAMAVFAVIHEYNSGVIRAYSLLAILTGMLFYQKILRKPICGIGEKLKKELQKRKKQCKMKKVKKKQEKSGQDRNEDGNEQEA